VPSPETTGAAFSTFLVALIEEDSLDLISSIAYNSTL